MTNANKKNPFFGESEKCFIANGDASLAINCLWTRSAGSLGSLAANVVQALVVRVINTSMWFMQYFEVIMW